MFIDSVIPYFIISNTESHMMLYYIFSSLQGVPGSQGRSGSPGDRVSVRVTALIVTLVTNLLLCG